MTFPPTLFADKRVIFPGLFIHRQLIAARVMAAAVMSHSVARESCLVGDLPRTIARGDFNILQT